MFLSAQLGDLWHLTSVLATKGPLTLSGKEVNVKGDVKAQVKAQVKAIGEVKVKEVMRRESKGWRVKEF